jgi:hypothetical protein
MDPKNFFAELKRRNIYGIAVGYTLVGWIRRTRSPDAPRK